MYHCPKCGMPLEHIGKDRLVLCGGINYYRCPNLTCKTIWKENQSGITPRSDNLTEVPEYEIDSIMESI